MFLSVPTSLETTQAELELEGLGLYYEATLTIFGIVTGYELTWPSRQAHMMTAMLQRGRFGRLSIPGLKSSSTRKRLGASHASIGIHGVQLCRLPRSGAVTTLRESLRGSQCHKS